MQGEYRWHKHNDDDEFFFCLDGDFLVDLEERTIALGPQQGIVVPEEAKMIGVYGDLWARSGVGSSPLLKRVSLKGKIMRTYALFSIVVCGASAIATASSAATRDDVLSGISRCGSIADDRSWLDCIYGAAQPMRAQLGLPPALASQRALVPPAMPSAAAASVQKTTMPQQVKPFSYLWPF